MLGMSDIFVSYHHEDRPRAERVAKALQAQKWTVWWDREILGGKRWEEEIAEELKSARCVVVLWSKVSIQSDWVKDEATEAAGRRVLIPVLLDDVVPPLGLRRIQTVNLIDWSGDPSDIDFGYLLRSIESILGNDAKPQSGSTPEQEKPASANRENFFVGLAYAPGKFLIALCAVLDSIASKIKANVKLPWLRVGVTVIGLCIATAVADFTARKIMQMKYPSDNGDTPAGITDFSMIVLGITLTYKVWNPKIWHPNAARGVSLFVVLLSVGAMLTMVLGFTDCSSLVATGPLLSLVGVRLTLFATRVRNLHASLLGLTAPALTVFLFLFFWPLLDFNRLRPIRYVALAYAGLCLAYSGWILVKIWRVERRVQ
jgi:hypothetical protein